VFLEGAGARRDPLRKSFSPSSAERSSLETLRRSSRDRGWHAVLKRSSGVLKDTQSPRSPSSPASQPKRSTTGWPASSKAIPPWPTGPARAARRSWGGTRLGWRSNSTKTPRSGDTTRPPGPSPCCAITSGQSEGCSCEREEAPARSPCAGLPLEAPSVCVSPARSVRGEGGYQAAHPSCPRGESSVVRG
jgi:hypothetical protein